MSGLHSTLSRSLGPGVLGVASREMDDLFDRLFTSGGNGRTKPWWPSMSVWEQDDHYHLEMDLPGLANDDIDVTFEEGRLKIAANRSRVESEDRTYLHDERNWGEFSRLISIPDSVDPESIEANYENGVLHLLLKKRPEVMPKKITINAK
ncbi:Hsp20/alpha crystallin family protein [Stieleria sp. ICT_E10.1]|uniref:Hsp20/alpha crystallin family protein n=1 Tax=Stieleria sedimenti TaxID=2976331 RepID=UPI00217F9D0C|nr:Hsp20/alpha crystallin family protein [Stieleria sedimenti]MCS7471060.1 Hsp20/alpha crystallin family protein [Stieleria sedimenti]